MFDQYGSVLCVLCKLSMRPVTIVPSEAASARSRLNAGINSAPGLALGDPQAGFRA